MNKTEIFNDFESFLNRPDESVNGVSPEFAKKYPDYAKQNGSNVGCWNCKDCHECIDCNNCNICEHCDYCNSCDNCNDCNDCKGCEHCHDCMFCSNVAKCYNRCKL